MIETPSIPFQKKTLTFHVPHVLTSVDGAAKTVREGGAQQIEHEIETSFSEDLPTEKPLRIEVTRQIAIGGARLNVLTDGLNGVLPSSPTASEYMKLVGQRVLVGITPRIDQALTNQNEGKPVYKVVRVFIPSLP